MTDRPRRRLRLAALVAAGGAAFLAIAPVSRTDPPGPPPAAPPSARERAAQLLLEGKAEASAAAFAEALAADGGDEVAIEGRVRALLRAGRWRQGLDEAKRHAAARPGSALVTTALGQAFFRGGLLREAAACLSPVASGPAPPARALMTLGLVRVAEGNEDEGAGLLDRALALAPEDRDVILEAAGAAPTRADAIARLKRYLDRSAGDDPDRIDGAKGTIRIYQALGERKVWVRATRPDRVEVPLSALRNPNGTLSGFVVEMSAASGRPLRLLLDSGSTGLYMVERIAVKGGFTPLAEETTFGGGGEGRHATRTGLLPVAAIGDLRFTDALVKTTTQELEPTGRYHGLLGLSIFQGYRLTIDLARAKLVLETAAPTAPGSSPAPAGSPYWSVASQMLVDAGTLDGRSGLFLFDTGASASLLSLDFADAAPGAFLGGATHVQAYGGALRDAREVRGVKLRFQGLETSGGSMTASDLTQRSRLGGVEVSGYLGLDLLARTVVTVDTVTRRVTVMKPAKR